MVTIEHINYAVKKITTGLQKKPNEPQFKIKNNRNKDFTIFSISLMFDKQFSTNGNITIDFFGTTNYVVADLRAGDLEDVEGIIIDLGSDGYNFRRNNTLRFFLWREGAGADVSLTLDVTSGEKIIAENQFVQQVNFRGSGIQRGDRR